MLKNETIKRFWFWPLLLGVAAFSGLFLFAVPIKLEAYAPAENGTLYVYLQWKLIIVDPNGEEETIRCRFDKLSGIEIDEDKIALHYETAVENYLLDEKRVVSGTSLQKPYKKQKLKEPITVGGSTYTYKNTWGRWSIIQTTPDGDSIVRYRMSAAGYAALIIGGVFGLFAFITMIPLTIHMWKNYEYKKVGIFWVTVQKDPKEEDAKWIKKGVDR